MLDSDKPGEPSTLETRVNHKSTIDINQTVCFSKCSPTFFTIVLRLANSN